METNIVIEKVAFEGEVRGYLFKAMYLVESSDALIEISKNGEIVRQFFLPSYKIWNIAAHAYDIVDGLEEGNNQGLEIAASNGIDINTVLLTFDNE